MYPKLCVVWVKKCYSELSRQGLQIDQQRRDYESIYYMYLRVKEYSNDQECETVG